MEDFKYTPQNGISNREYFPTQPVDEDAARAQFQNMYNQILNFLNSYKNSLQKNTGADCGSAQIGSAPIAGLNGNNIYAQIASLKTQINSICTQLGITIS